MRATDLRKRAEHARARATNQHRSTGLSPIWTAIAGVVAGAIGALLLDPQRGKARRARILDQGAAMIRSLGRDVERQARHVQSDIQGKAQALRAGGDGKSAQLNDAALAAKVQTELFADPSLPKGGINVNVEYGRVVLRGEVPSAEMRAHLETTASRVPGVLGVENLLHLPGEVAPVGA